MKRTARELREDRLLDLRPGTRTHRVVSAFKRNKSRRAKIVAALRQQGYGAGLSDDDDSWLDILLEVVKALLPLLIKLI